MDWATIIDAILVMFIFILVLGSMKAESTVSHTKKRTIVDNLKFVNRIYGEIGVVTKSFQSNMFRCFGLLTIEQIENLDNGKIFPICLGGKSGIFIEGDRLGMIVGDDFGEVFVS